MRPGSIFWLIPLAQIVIALGTVLLAAFVCRNPSPFVTGLLTHRRRWWFAMGLLLAPYLASSLAVGWMSGMLLKAGISLPRMMPGQLWPYIQWVMRLELAFACGAAGCWAAATREKSTGEVRFHLWRGLVVAFALSGIVTTPSLLLPWLGWLAPFVAVVVIFTYQMTERRETIGPRQLAAPAVHPMFGVLLGIAPTFLLLLLRTLSASGSGPFGDIAMVWFCCVASLGCCFGSGFILFQRRTALAITGGILFMLLNALFSFWFGCVAVFSGMKF